MVFWGGHKDIQKMLEENGFKVFNVSVGPIKLDHYQSVGHMITEKKRGVVDSIYINYANLLLSLPPD